MIPQKMMHGSQKAPTLIGLLRPPGDLKDTIMHRKPHYFKVSKTVQEDHIMGQNETISMLLGIMYQTHGPNCTTEPEPPKSLKTMMIGDIFDFGAESQRCQLPRKVNLRRISVK